MRHFRSLVVLLSLGLLVSNIAVAEATLLELFQQFLGQNKPPAAGSGPGNTTGPDTTPEVLYKLKTVKDLVTHWGYPYEEKTVNTADGVKLTLHRVKHGRKEMDQIKAECADDEAALPCILLRENIEAAERPPVLLAHGVMSSSSSFTFGPPENSLAYLLADAGFDVWMYNSRGSLYSTAHSDPKAEKPCPFDTWNVQVALSKTGIMGDKPMPAPRKCDESFWNFELDDMATKDLPAVIDNILTWTNHKQLDYVGHSMGGTLYTVLLAEKPEYNSKIRTGILLSPAVFMGHSYIIFDVLSFLATEIGLIYTSLFETSNLMPHNVIDLVNIALILFLHKDPLCTGSMNQLCHQISPIFGINPYRLDPAWIPLYLNHFPQGTSVNTMVHFGQLASKWNKKNEFLKYDYGGYVNNQVYNQERPPPYNLTNVVAPTILVSAEFDKVTNPFDIEILSRSLPNLIQYRTLDYGFNHMDYVIAKDAGEVINQDVVRWLLNPKDSIPVYSPLTGDDTGGSQGLLSLLQPVVTVVPFLFTSVARCFMFWNCNL